MDSQSFNSDPPKDRQMGRSIQIKKVSALMTALYKII